MKENEEMSGLLQGSTPPLRAKHKHDEARAFRNPAPALPDKPLQQNVCLLAIHAVRVELPLTKLILLRMGFSLIWLPISTEIRENPDPAKYLLHTTVKVSPTKGALLDPKGALRLGTICGSCREAPNLERFENI